jgi:hypothetical protein
MKNLISKEEKDRIDSKCKEYKIRKYSISPNGSIDTKGDVDLCGIGFSRLPLRFGKVDGFFYCHDNVLSTLDGSPHTVGGDFDCNDNGFTSLVGGPKNIGGDFICSHNNLISLDGSPTTIGGDYICAVNKLASTYAGDTDIEVSGNTLCFDNNLPPQLMNNVVHIKLILKYQRHFFIWNDDLTLNEENFKDLISEIEDGLL